MTRYPAFTLLKRIFRYARPYWTHILILFLLNLLATPLALLEPIPLKIIIDSGIGSDPLPASISMFLPGEFSTGFANIVLLSVGIIILIALLTNLRNLLNWVLQSFTGEKLVLRFRLMLFEKIQQLSLKYHDERGTADSLYRIQYDAYTIYNLVVNGLSPFITSGFTLLGMFYVMALIDWHFSIIAIALIPPLFILTRISSSRLRHEWGKVKESESAAMAVIHEVFSALRVVLAFGQESHERMRFEKQSDKAIQNQLRVAWTSGTYNLVMGLIMATGTAAVLYTGANYVQSNKITLGELVMVMAYLTQLFGPLMSISNTINHLQGSFASAERVFSLIDQEPEVMERPNAIPIKRAKGAVSFNQVSFGYSDNAKVIHNVSFDIQPGQLVGILGSTGSGKSTIISLLTRFYEPLSGKITMDDIDIRDYKLRDYRNQFGIVLQEPVLFSTTIAENIAYGRPDASMAEIIAAAKAANAHSFIEESEAGYKTQVGERGTQLSGGERQRISLARAFLKDAPILILDEPTSSVDVETEATIMEAIRRLVAGRTSFLITHRLDTLEQCDVLIQIEKGKVEAYVSENDPNQRTLRSQLLKKGIK